MVYKPYNPELGDPRIKLEKRYNLVLDDLTVKENVSTTSSLWNSAIGYCEHSSLAKGHNPFNLTDNDVGEGYRLLEFDEISSTRFASKFIEKSFFDDKDKLCWDNSEWEGSEKKSCYRTRLSKDRLRFIDKLMSSQLNWFTFKSILELYKSL